MGGPQLQNAAHAFQLEKKNMHILNTVYCIVIYSSQHFMSIHIAAFCCMYKVCGIFFKIFASSISGCEVIWEAKQQKHREWQENWRGWYICALRVISFFWYGVGKLDSGEGQTRKHEQHVTQMCKRNANVSSVRAFLHGSLAISVFDIDIPVI